MKKPFLLLLFFAFATKLTAQTNTISYIQFTRGATNRYLVDGVPIKGQANTGKFKGILKVLNTQEFMVYRVKNKLDTIKTFLQIDSVQWVQRLNRRERKTMAGILAGIVVAGGVGLILDNKTNTFIADLLLAGGYTGSIVTPLAIASTFLVERGKRRAKTKGWSMSLKVNQPQQ
jgi:hypothetical protein